MVETFSPGHKLSKERNRDIPLAGRWVGTHRQMLQLSHIKRYDMIRLINIDAASKHVWTGKLEERTEVLQSTCRTFMALIHNSQHVQYRIHIYIFIIYLFIYRYCITQPLYMFDSVCLYQFVLAPCPNAEHL